ncbi:unnamed protein product, partial [Aphanomyces euteiches]
AASGRGADVTADLAWPNTPAEEVIAGQQVALVVALRDRDEAREYLRERGNDVLQLRGELHESNTTQHALSEQVVKQNVEIKRLSALVESERVMRETAQGLHGPLIQPGLQKVIEELKESEEKRQDLVKEAATSAAEIARLKEMLKAVLNDQDERDRVAAEVVKEARHSKEMLKKWQIAFEEVAALRDEVIPKIEELRDRLVLALRNGVMGDEGLRGVVDFMNWSRDSFLVVGDLSGWVKAWHARAPFEGTVNVIGTGPAQTSSPEVPLPAIADVTLVDGEVTRWRAHADDVVARLRDGVVSDPEILAVLVPDAIVGSQEAAGNEAQTSFISPRSQPQVSAIGVGDSNLTFTEDGTQVVADASGDLGRKRPSAASTSKSKRSCKGSHLAAMKSPRSAATGAARHKDVTPAIVSAYEAIMATKPWERYHHLPSIFPEERANEATRMVDEALKAFWQKRGREVFERMFYLKLDSATDKYGSLDQIAGPLEMVLASLKVAEEDCAGTQHLSPIAYFCSPRHQWPILFKAPICLKTMFSTHGGNDQAERVVLAYLEESKQWFPQVPSLVRQQDKLLEWTCDPATTFKYYSQRGALKSKPHGDLAKNQAQTIDDLKVVCTQAISLVITSPSVCRQEPFDPLLNADASRKFNTDYAHIHNGKISSPSSSKPTPSRGNTIQPSTTTQS